MSTDFFIHAFSLFLICLLFTPFPVTRFAMHRIYANRINSRRMSRDFGIFMPKHLAEQLRVNSNNNLPLQTDRKSISQSVKQYIYPFLCEFCCLNKSICLRHISDRIYSILLTVNPFYFFLRKNIHFF